MKEYYKPLEIELVFFEEDVIRTSSKLPNDDGEADIFG